MRALSLSEHVRLVIGRYVFRVCLDYFLLDALLPDRWLEDE